MSLSPSNVLCGSQMNKDPEPVEIPATVNEQPVFVIDASNGSGPIKELLDYRALFIFWVWRSIKVRYAQNALGIGWAVIQPVFSMLVFTASSPPNSTI